MLKPKLITTLKTYNLQSFLHDLSAGVIVGIVALPLAIAFAIASGVGPERGLFTAIIGGFIISFLGGSRVQIGGPTGAFVVIVFSIVQQYGYSGLVTATIMAGIFLIALGLLRLGGLIKFIPYSIVTGFTGGIAVIIFASQIGDFLGLGLATLPADFIGKIETYALHIAQINVYAVLVASLSLTLIALWPKISKRIPGALIVLVLGTVLVYFLKIPVETIGSRFGSIPTMLPAPSLPDLNLATIGALISPAISIAMLAAIESLLSAQVADGMTGFKHRSNMELIAQGVANIVAPIFGGIPATGAIARTATNVKNGARTPIAGIVHALTLLAIMLVLGGLAVYIPMPILAAILIHVSWNMAERHAFKIIFKGQRSDALILATTFLITVFFDLTVAIEVGLAMAAILFIKKMVDLSNVSIIKRELSDDEEEDPSANQKSKNEVPIPSGVAVFELDGPFFFGTVQKFEDTINSGGFAEKVQILRMNAVNYIDADGLHAIEELHRLCGRHHIALLVSEIHTQPYMMVTKTGLDTRMGKHCFLATFDDALKKAALIVMGVEKN